MKKISRFKLKTAILFFTILIGTGVTFAQSATTSKATSTDPNEPYYGGLTREQFIEAERKKYIEAITPKNDPYANLSQEEYDKLPLSAKMPDDIKEQLSIDITPEVPHPGEKVTITVSAYGGIDVNASVIDWIVDGKSSLRGVGKKAFSFYPAGNGKVTNVELHVKPQYGLEVVRSFKFNPSEVDILWQADTYTAPFYKGKALYTPQSDVQFVAMPNITRKNGQKIQPQSTVYKWELNYNADAENSGYGVNYYNFTGSILAKPTTVGVTAYDPLDNSSTGIGTLDIENIQPILLMYEIHPTYGPLFNTAATGAFTFNQDDIKLGAYPFFYSATAKNDVAYEWSINGAKLNNIPGNQDFLVLQKLKQESGESTISVSASNGDKVLQQSRTSLDLMY